MVWITYWAIEDAVFPLVQLDLSFTSELFVLWILLGRPVADFMHDELHSELAKED